MDSTINYLKFKATVMYVPTLKNLAFGKSKISFRFHSHQHEFILVVLNEKPETHFTIILLWKYSEQRYILIITGWI